MRHRSRVIVLGSNAALRIRNGALDLEHGPAAERIKLKIDIDEPKPCAILFDGRGEFITGEAIRFCARYAIDIILPNGPGRAILFTESALEATGRRDVARRWPGHYPRSMRRRSGSSRAGDCAGENRGRREGVWPSPDGARLFDNRPMRDEAGQRAQRRRNYCYRGQGGERLLALASRFGAYRAQGRQFAALMVALRQSGKGRGISRQQTCLAPNFRDDQLLHRCRSRAISACALGLGLALQIGFLHADKHGRNSLVWDAIEPLRASINARVFAFVASHEFARSDFPASGVSTHRIAQPIIAELLARCLSPDQDSRSVLSLDHDRMRFRSGE